MDTNIVNTLDNGERVTSTYAEIYLNDDHCDIKKPLTTLEPTNSVPKPSKKLSTKSKLRNDELLEDIWTSPSDLLIGIIELLPPFTSKITRGKTHEGILAIGNEILEKEYAKFMKHVTTLLHENDSAWSHILEHEKASVKNKVKDIYDKIFMEKSNIMKREIAVFYETTLQELESSLKTQVDSVLITAHANIISDLNTEINQKLKKERLAIEEVLQERYASEVAKLKHYYKLLLQNELQRFNKLVNSAIHERNDAFKAFCRQIEAENITSTMYILCMERKKCKIKQFILANYQNLDLSEKYEKIKKRQNIITAFQERDVPISAINKSWQEKIHKVLEIFLKFISFSLKLLPEQTSFLLDIEKMVVLQLNEIQKVPKKAPSIIVDSEKFQNIFKFDKLEKAESECIHEPFTVVGDLSDPIPPHYGSTETLPSNVDLPVIRLERQYVYAKCHGYEGIKTILEAQRCKCSDKPKYEKLLDSASSSDKDFKEDTLLNEKESSNELLILDDIRRLHECPARGCKDWAKRFSFPYLDSYIDFSEENYERVKTVLGKLPKTEPTPELLDPKRLVFNELQFAATREPYHTVETQYSSQEDLYIPDLECPCLNDMVPKKHRKHSHEDTGLPSHTLNEILTKRKISLRRLMQQNPSLLKMFTDESFDFIM